MRGCAPVAASSSFARVDERGRAALVRELDSLGAGAAAPRCGCCRDAERRRDRRAHARARAERANPPAHRPPPAAAVRRLRRPRPDRGRAARCRSCAGRPSGARARAPRAPALAPRPIRPSRCSASAACDRHGTKAGLWMSTDRPRLRPRRSRSAPAPATGRETQTAPREEVAEGVPARARRARSAAIDSLAPRRSHRARAGAREEARAVGCEQRQRPRTASARRSQVLFCEQQIASLVAHAAPRQSWWIASAARSPRRCATSITPREAASASSTSPANASAATAVHEVKRSSDRRAARWRALRASRPRAHANLHAGPPRSRRQPSRKPAADAARSDLSRSRCDCVDDQRVELGSKLAGDDHQAVDALSCRSTSTRAPDARSSQEIGRLAGAIWPDDSSRARTRARSRVDDVAIVEFVDRLRRGAVPAAAAPSVCVSATPSSSSTSARSSRPRAALSSARRRYAAAASGAPCASERAAA